MERLREEYPRAFTENRRSTTCIEYPGANTEHGFFGQRHSERSSFSRERGEVRADLRVNLISLVRRRKSPLPAFYGNRHSGIPWKATRHGEFLGPVHNRLAAAGCYRYGRSIAYYSRFFQRRAGSFFLANCFSLIALGS